MFNMVVLAVGFTIPFFIENAAWWHWLAWPAGMWMIFGGWSKVFVVYRERYQAMREGDKIPTQTSKLNAKQLELAKAFGIEYANLGATLNIRNICKNVLIG